jgi:hypothetical protein
MESAATQHGKDNEDLAIDKFERMYGTHVLQFSLIPHDTKDWLAVSPDGITPDGVMVEVKCPYSRAIKPAEAYAPFGCPKYYYPQVQAQLEVCDLELCKFVQYWKDEDHMLVTDIPRDREWWAKYEPEFKQFWDEVLEFRRTHPDWETVDYHPPKVKKPRKRYVDLDDDSEHDAKRNAVIDTPIVVE